MSRGNRGRSSSFRVFRKLRAFGNDSHISRTSILKLPKSGNGLLGPSESNYVTFWAEGREDSDSF